jgi:hypothetical protein
MGDPEPVTEGYPIFVVEVKLRSRVDDFDPGLEAEGYRDVPAFVVVLRDERADRPALRLLPKVRIVAEDVGVPAAGRNVDGFEGVRLVVLADRRGQGEGVADAAFV